MTGGPHYSFSEAIATSHGIAVGGLSGRQRAKLTGNARNNAEAEYFRGFLSTLEREMHFKGPGAVLPHLRNLKTSLDRLNGKLTLTAELPTYAPVWQTPELNRRTVDEALAVAGANLRRAISGGDLGTAFKYLDVMREAVHLASNEGRA
ncbi:hypothetical protein ACVWZX_001359 [Deinococcus sp. UYEF24]